MYSKGLFIVGTEGTRLIDIVMEYINRFEGFHLVKLFSTKGEQNISLFELLDIEKFNELSDKNMFLCTTQIDADYYGISRDAIDKVIMAGKIPLVLAIPEFIDLIDENDFMTFYIDEHNDSMDKNMEVNIVYRRKLHLELGKKFLYNMINLNVNSTVELIHSLWEHRYSSGSLSYRIIKLMVECGMLLTGANLSNIKGASYDLTLGNEYYYKGEIEEMSDKKPLIWIEPYDYIIATSKEMVKFPRDVTGRFDLSVSLFYQGIILSNGPCVDPGFNGRLFCLLFNTSNKPVFLKKGQHYATLEIQKIIEPTKPYDGKYQGKEKISDYLPPNSMMGGINELKREVEELKSESKNLQNTLLGFISIMLALISVLLIMR